MESVPPLHIDPPPELVHFLDSGGRLKKWPARKRRSLQIAALQWIATFFEAGRTYREREVNEIIKSHIAFEDYVLVRRELFELGLLGRTSDGRSYWRTSPVE